MGAVWGVAPRFHDVELDLPGMEAAAVRYAASDPAGGDFGAVLRCAGNEWALALGHVSTHDDVGAAADVERAAVGAAVRRQAGVVAVLRTLNRRLLESPRRGRTVRLALGRLELDRCGAWVTLGCGGHPLPMLVRRAGWVDVRGQAGPPLGVSDEADFGEDRVGLGPGDALVFSSAAVTGARDVAGEAFAHEGLPEALLAGAGEPADVLADRLLAAAAAHAGRELSDDAAVVVIRVPPDAADDPDARIARALGSFDGATDLPGYPVGQPHWAPNHRPSPPREARILLPGTASSVREARRFTAGVLHSWRLSELAEAGDVELITSELAGNAVRHARRDVTVLVGYDGQRVRIAVGDGSRELPQSRRAGDDDVDGRGLLIVQTLAADVGVARTVGGKRVWAEVDAPGAPARV